MLLLELDMVLVVGAVMVVLDVVAAALDVIVCVDVALDPAEVDDVPVCEDVPDMDPSLLAWLSPVPPLVAPEDAAPEALPATVLPDPLPDIAWLPPSLFAAASPDVCPSAPVDPEVPGTVFAEPVTFDPPAPPSLEAKSTFGNVQASATTAQAVIAAALANKEAALGRALGKRMVRTSP